MHKLLFSYIQLCLYHCLIWERSHQSSFLTLILDKHFCLDRISYSGYRIDSMISIYYIAMQPFMTTGLFWLNVLHVLYSVWGLAHFHFTRKFYHFSVRQLVKISCFHSSCIYLFYVCVRKRTALCKPRGCGAASRNWTSVACPHGEHL